MPIRDPLSPPPNVLKLAKPAVDAMCAALLAALERHPEAVRITTMLIDGWRRLPVGSEGTPQVEALLQRSSDLTWRVCQELCRFNAVGEWLRPEDLRVLLWSVMGLCVFGSDEGNAASVVIGLRQLWPGQRAIVSIGPSGTATFDSRGADLKEIRSLLPYFEWQAKLTGSAEKKRGKPVGNLEYDPTEMQPKIDAAAKQLRRDGRKVNQTTLSTWTGYPQQTLSDYARKRLIHLPSTG